MKKLLVLGLCFMASTVLAQDSVIFGDMRPDAPELAPRGEYGVGVRTLSVTHSDQIDILNATDASSAPTYDRTLTLEVWYPATIPEGETPLVTYDETLGRADDP